MTRSDLGRKAASGAAWVMLDQAGLQVMSLVVFAIMAHYLDPHAFGLAAICFVLVNMCKSVLIDTFTTPIVRKPDGTDLEYSTAFWITVGVSGVVFVAMQGLSLLVDRLFNTSGLGVVLRATSIMLLVQGVAHTQEAWLGRHFLYRTLAVRSLIGALVGGGAGVAMAMNGFGIWALVVQQVTTSLMAFTLLWFTCPWRPGIAFSRTTGREILLFARSLIGGNVAYAFQQNCDTLLIGLYSGPSAAGLYNVAKRLRLSLQLGAATPINAVALPSLVEAQRDPVQFPSIFLMANLVVFSICAPLFLGAAAVSGDIITLLFGANWATAAPVFAWLAIGGLCSIMIDYNNNVFIIRNHPVWTLWLALLNVALVLVSFLALPPERIEFLAVPFVLPYVVLLPVSAVLLHRVIHVDVRRWIGSLLIPIAAACIMVAVLYLVRPPVARWAFPPLARLSVLIASGAAVYACALCALKPSFIVQARGLLRQRRTASVADV